MYYSKKAYKIRIYYKYSNILQIFEYITNIRIILQTFEYITNIRIYFKIFEYFRIFEYISRYSNIFQDIPFSLPNFYKELYKEFPEAYYILTVRDSSEVWYNSLDRFYKKSFPNKYHKIHEIEYIRKGWLYSYLTDCLNSPKTEPLNKSSLVAVYENHISDVEEFFKDKPNLIKINLTNPLDFNRLEKFLGNKFKSTSFPHLNKT